MKDETRGQSRASFSLHPSAFILVLLLLATGLRFHRLGAQSFWNDEGNSARLSERSLPAIIEGTASDIHPPLYYLLLRGWRELAGETEFGLRAFSAYAGILTVAVVVALARTRGDGRPLTDDGRRTTDDRRPLNPLPGGEGTSRQNPLPNPLPEGEGTGRRRNPLPNPLPGGEGTSRQNPLPNPLPEGEGTSGPPISNLQSPFIPLLLAATAPVLVYYSQETRMYALLALWAVLSTWAVLLWLAGRQRRHALAYVLLAAAGLYTHYFFPAVLVAQGLVVLLATADRRRTTAGPLPNLQSPISQSPNLQSPIVPWLALAAAALALYAPWLPIFLRQVGGRGGERLPLPTFLADSARWLTLGSTIARDEATWAVAAALALAALGVVVAFAGQPSSVSGRRSAVVLPLLIPLALLYAAGATDPAFFKFLLVAVPFLCLLMGLGWAVPRRWRWLPALLTAVVLAGSAVSLSNLYSDPAFARADYRGMAARIAADGGNVGVILVAPNQWEVFTYYHRGGAPVYPLPAGQPDPAILEPELARIAAAHERLYVLYWGERQRDPQGVIERWLDGHTFKAAEEWVGDVRLALYAVAPSTTAAPATPSGATFAARDGETITLRDFAIWPPSARPGQVVAVRLNWSADAPTARPYKVFLHLLADSNGPPVAQRDGEPAGGSRPTTTWAAGEVINDNHGLLLPAGLPPGEYTLRLGLYDAFDPAARLAVGGGDSVLLGVLTVE